jgi:hypothetical protein
MIVGANITANRNCTTFVNDLTIVSASACSGCGVCVSTNGLLVPFTAGGGGIMVLGAGSLSTERCGVSNSASGSNSSALGGTCNVASGTCATIVGGEKNLAQALNSFIGGGECNNTCNSTSGCLSYGAVVVGGVGNNTTGGTWSLASCCFTSAPTICNAGLYSFVGSGLQNRATGNISVVVGGCQNNLSSNSSFIGAGECNTALNNGTTTGCDVIVGGFANQINTCILNSDKNFIGAGRNNAIVSSYSGIYDCNLGQNAIVAGRLNCIDAYFTGSGNYSGHSFIGAGCGNCTLGCYHGILGGRRNVINICVGGSITGGTFNCTTGTGTNNFIGGGGANVVTGTSSATLGGQSNQNSGQYSAILGGTSNILSGYNSTISGGYGNTNSGYTSFIGNGQKLLTNARYSFVGAGNCNAICNSTCGNLAGLSVVVGGVGNNTSGGTWNTSNFNFDSSPTICNAGQYSFIGGGFQNRASACSSSVTAGFNNVNCGAFSHIANGCSNNISPTVCHSSIVGGFSNVIMCGNGNSSSCSFIGGGSSNYVGFVTGAVFSSIVGGNNNIIYQCNSFVGGGQTNQVNAEYGIVVGGLTNRVVASYGGVFGGANNCVSNPCSYIIGTAIVSDRNCTTFVNNLSIKSIPTSSAGLPSGSVWRNGNVLNIV